MFHIKTLPQFIDYCNEYLLIAEEDEEEDTFGFWVLSAVGKNISKEELIKDATTTLETYYKWLQQAVQNEMYLSCGIIYRCIELENDHYTALGQALYKKNISRDINDINARLRTQYL